jgi:O-acetyl-ADP-ribose deacetylase (regulator of RNase III)
VGDAAIAGILGQKKLNAKNLLTGFIVRIGGMGVMRNTAMIEYTSGNILKCEADALVNPVNCIGVMGRGLALKFKNDFPENYRAYEAACRRKAVQPGRMFVFETDKRMPHCIINFPTKRHWRDKSQLEDIESGLVDLVKVIRDRGIRSIAIPPLGCGLGGLAWNDVRPRIERTLSCLNGVRVLVIEPNCNMGRRRLEHSGGGVVNKKTDAIREIRLAADRLAEAAERVLAGWFCQNEIGEPWIEEISDIEALERELRAYRDITGEKKGEEGWSIVEEEP